MRLPCLQILLQILLAGWSTCPYVGAPHWRQFTPSMKTVIPKLLLPLAAVSFAGLLLSSSLQAAVMYGTAGASYSQNFNLMETTAGSHTWTNDDTTLKDGTTKLTGWYWAKPSGTSSSTYTVINREPGTASGLANQQDFPLSIGNLTDNTDRAFGTQSASGAEAADNFAHYGLQLKNTTGATLTEFTLSFTAEQWRTINNESADQLTFDYQVFSSGSGNQIAAASGWADVADFKFVAPITTTTGSRWLDGNASANREVFSAKTITGINWGAGEELWLRWNDVSGKAGGGGLHAMMGIDDVTFSAAVPEPSTFALIGLFAGAALLRRRRRI